MSVQTADAELLQQQGIALALHDVSSGRNELQRALLAFTARSDQAGRLVAASALLVFIGIADDDYTGFEAAVAAVAATRERLADVQAPEHRLLAGAGALVAGWFADLTDAALPAQAEAIVRALGDASVAPALRCAAGLAALGYFDARMDLEGVLWLELAMRPLLADAAVGVRLRDEAYHAFVQALYQCEAAPRALALRAQRSASGPAPLPAIALKLLLLDAQLALGSGRAEAGRAALAEAEPLLQPSAPRAASWWHLLRSRLDLLEGRQRQALTHARLALRLGSESQLPERWMGVTVMQEGHVRLAAGEPAHAVPFFERAGRAASGSQAQFCWCLAHLTRALQHLQRADTADPADAERFATGRRELSAGLALARELSWLHFFRAAPNVAATVCAWALQLHIEAPFVREVIAARALQAVRPDVAAWPWPIRITTLGRFRIELNGSELAFKGKVARKPLELLQFIIASSGSDVSAGSAAFGLWRDLEGDKAMMWRDLEGDKAMTALNVALFRLRKLLGYDDAVLLELGRLSLNAQRVWVDCLAFEQQADAVGSWGAEPLGTAARGAAERALGLYAGAFLQGTADDAWQLVYRSRLASKFKRLVTLLARAAIARGDGTAARALLERGLEFDPLAEDLARDLMRELIDSGEQAVALAVFERCRDAIARDLGALPSAATLALVAHIRGAPAA
jgi:DNA-binding SARP family transcriptional activator